MFFLKSVRSKLILAFIVLIIFPSTIIGTVLYYRTINILQEKTGSAMVDGLKQDVESIENFLTETYYLAIRLSSSNEVISDIDRISSLDPKQLNRQLIDMSLDYSKTVKKYRYLDSIYIYIPQIKKVITTYGIKSTVDITDENEYTWLKLIKNPENYTRSWISVLYIKDDFFSHEKNFFTISKAIKNYNHKEPIGELCINIDERVLFFNFLNSGGKKIKNTTYVVNPEGKVISHPKVDLIGLNFSQKPYVRRILNRDEGYFVETINGEKCLVTYITSKLTDYRIISLIPQREIISEVLEVKKYAFKVIGISVVISIILGFISSIIIYRPIKEIRNAMEEVGKGNFDIKINDKREDEFGILNKGFNQMVWKVNHLFNEVYLQKLLKKEAELQALQSQITPHFMYNTLNSIRCTAMLQGSNVVSDMLGALIELLQLSAGNKRDFITIKEEIQQVKNYILLQKFRYRDLFDVAYEIDDSILDYKVPKLVLQPLVENSIKYGINLRSANGEIIIRAIKDIKDILLEVEDNGTGIEKERLKDVIQGNNEEKVGGIGINNINKRIKLYYGKSYGLTIRNKDSGGVIVRIRIPIVSEGGNENA